MQSRLSKKNGVHDAILAAMDNVVFPGVEIAVRSITGSSSHEPNSVVQKPEGRDLMRNTENTPLKQDKVDETRAIESFEDGDLLVLRPNFDQQAHAHQNKTLARSKIRGQKRGKKQNFIILLSHDKYPG